MSGLLAVILGFLAWNANFVFCQRIQDLEAVRQALNVSQNTNAYQNYFHPVAKALTQVSRLETFAHLHSVSHAVDFNTTIAELAGNLTMECLEDVFVIGEGAYKLYKNESTAMMMPLLQLIDSNAARGAGILRGGFKLYGFKQECNLISLNVPARGRPLTTMYSRAFVNSDFSNTVPCDSASSFVNVDFCLPAACDKDDIKYILDTALSLANITVNPICSVETIQDVTVQYNYASWIVGIVIAAVGIIVIFAGVVDYFAIVKGQHQSLPIKVLLAFSLYTNTVQIFSAGKPRPGQITPLNCIRIWSMIWVIFGHTLVQFFQTSYNVVDFYSLMNYFFMEILLSAFFAVDSFLFMGGLMVSYMWFKAFYKHPKMLTNARGWVMFYVHRYLRLSPPYYMMILAYAYLFVPYMSGSVSFLVHGYKEDACRRHFWTNILYINNIVSNGDQCMGHTWYLGVDMQLYILTPIVLIPMALHRFGLIVPFILWCMSTAGNILIIYEKDWPPSVPIRATADFTEYFQLLYAAAWMRAPIYIQGLVVGWFLQSNKRLRVPPLINVALWCLGGALMLTVIFGLFRYYSETTWMMPIFWRAMYNAFSRPAWGLGLTWIVVSCFYGYGGPINRFMSWNIWNPLGKLSYCIYLVHYSLITYYYSLLDNAVYFTNFWSTVFYYVIPLVVISTVIGYIWAVLFEVPMGKLETILLWGERRPTIKKTLPEPAPSGEKNA